MTALAVEGLLAEPYVTVPEFRAAPTWLDTDDLIPGGTDDRQDDELYNVLLRASAWADNRTLQRLGAHTATEQLRVRPDRSGRLSIHPSNIPARLVTAISYGTDPANLATISDLSGVWIEDGRQILLTVPGRSNWTGFLEFGPPSSGDEVYVRISYTCAYASTTLTAPASAGASTVAVSAPAGIMPGDVLRIWDPGNEEAVTVAAGFVPGMATVPLAAPLASSHAIGAGLSGLPAELHQSIICYAVALLLREDVSSDEPFAGAEFGPAARRSGTGGRSGGLVDEAERMLAPYRRVR